MVHVATWTRRSKGGSRSDVGKEAKPRRSKGGSRSNPVAPRSPGSVSERDAETRAGVEAVEAYLEHHHTHISWQVTLNNHACTRPKKYGGPLVHSVTNYKTFLHVEPGSASAAVTDEVDVPMAEAPAPEGKTDPQPGSANAPVTVEHIQEIRAKALEEHAKRKPGGMADS